MRTVLRWIVISGCLWLLGGVTTAGNPLARPAKREAREHLDRGNRLYNTRSFEEAIAEYKAGALIEPATVFDYNLAQSYRQLGKYNEAIWHYERFLNYGQPDGELLDAVNLFLKEMRAQLANRAQTMPPNDPAPPGSDGATVPLARASPPGEPRHLGVSPEATTASAPGIDWFGWSMTGTGVATMAAAGAVLLSASHLSDQANMEPDTQRRNQLHEQSRTRSTIGTVIGIGGVGLTAAGIIKLALHAGETKHLVAATLEVGITSNGIFVVGNF
jgi:tetratricopeptide (TPR) repeat protein